MDNIIPSDEYTEFEGRLYSNPQIGLNESSEFIDNLRTSQGQQNQEIFQQTENLGTDISSNLGGLTGGESYFTSRFQTPQTSSAVSNLRAAAQATALNQVLANEQAKWQKRYNDAYRAYQQRANNPDGGTDGGIEYEDTDGITGVTAEPDTTQYSKDTTVYDSTEIAHDNRSTERPKKIGVTRDRNGNIASVTVNGRTYYGREARARYRYLQNAGLVE